MTKDRARKRATRHRAAATGERYVVARREAAEVLPQRGGRLHELTHRMPGVPAHLEGGLQGSTTRTRRAVPVHQGRAGHGEPRVLVDWQNRVARFFGAK
jgi:hypothetical protein